MDSDRFRSLVRIENDIVFCLRYGGAETFRMLDRTISIDLLSKKSEDMLSFVLSVSKTGRFTDHAIFIVIFIVKSQFQHIENCLSMR